MYIYHIHICIIWNCATHIFTCTYINTHTYRDTHTHTHLHTHKHTNTHTYFVSIQWHYNLFILFPCACRIVGGVDGIVFGIWLAAHASACGVLLYFLPHKFPGTATPGESKAFLTFPTRFIWSRLVFWKFGKLTGWELCVLHWIKRGSSTRIKH